MRAALWPPTDDGSTAGGGVAWWTAAQQHWRFLKSLPSKVLHGPRGG
jgi:hypothetical protein